MARIEAAPAEVSTPGDFVDLADRPAVDKTLQRLVAAGELRRIDRGLYDKPRKSNPTGKPTVPDYRAVIRAVTRRDQVRVVVDGMTAANDHLRVIAGRHTFPAKSRDRLRLEELASTAAMSPEGHTA